MNVFVLCECMKHKDAVLEGTDWGRLGLISRKLIGGSQRIEQRYFA